MERLKKIRILFFLALSLGARGEDSYVSLRVKRYNHGFFKVSSLERNYIDIEEFAEVIEGEVRVEGERVEMILSPTAEVILDMEKNTVTYNEEMTILKEGEVKIEGEKCLISIDLLERVGQVRYSEDDLLLEFTPDFPLRYEVKEEAVDRRMIFDNKRNGETTPHEVTVAEAPLFTLGKVKGTYSNRDLEDSEHTFDIDYTNRTLGGQLSTSIDTVEGDVSYWNLTYDDILKDKEIVIGDTTSNLSYLPNTGFEGLAIKSDSYSVKFGRVTIDGYAESGSVVELYKNGTLYDYVIAKGGEYSFENLEVNSSTEFLVRVYDEDSNYREEEIDLRSTRNIQEKGETDYNLFIGETDDHKRLKAGEVYYGVNEGTTLGGGYISLEDDYGGDFGQGSIIQRFKALPLAYRLTVQSNGDDTDYEGAVYLEVADHDLEYEFIRSQSDIYDFEDKDRISLGGSREGVYYDLAYTDEDESVEYEADLSFYLKNVALETGYTHRKDDEGVQSHIYSAKVSTPLWGRARGIAEIDIVDEEEKGLREEYEVRVQNYSSESSMEYSAFVRNDGEETRVGIEVSYDLIRGVTGTVNHYDGDTKFGVRAEKTLVLDQMEVTDDSMDESWVYGRIYYDENGNGIYDKEEKPAQGNILFNGEEISLEDGEYFIEGISPDGINKINISRFRMHPVWKAEDDYIYVEGRSGTGQRMDIPLVRMGNIPGASYLGAGTLEIYREGELVRSQETEEDGFFIVEDLPYGDYVLRVNGREVRYTTGDMEKERFIEIKEDGLEEDGSGVFYD